MDSRRVQHKMLLFVDFRYEHIRSVFRVADTSSGQHPSGRLIYSTYW